jgi:sulfite reductase (NADPH) hemoprotein beta-component
MSIVDDPRTLGRARLSFARRDEIDGFVATLERFERGEISPAEWRAFRLVAGTYGQRQEGDASMLRVKIPQGVLDGAQLRALADVAQRHSRGFGHVTTRQNLQLHFMALDDVAPAMRRLAQAGLTTREACGNAVRNVTACPWAGVAADEAFDPTPYAEALTRHLLRHPLSAVLPRKFKIAFEGCAEDHVLTAINDLGFRARLRRRAGRSERGFGVTVGGGTAVRPTSGLALTEFLPAGELLGLAEAVLRLYHRLGDYQHRQRNRLKYLISEMGAERFRAELEDTFAALRREGLPPLPFDPEDPPVEAAPAWPGQARQAPPDPAAVEASAAAAELRGPGIVPPARLRVVGEEAASFWRHNVRLQKQPGFAAVTVTLPLGDVTSAQLRLLADLAESLADGTLRTTPEQNLVLRWVPERQVAALYARLAAAGLGAGGAGTAADVTSCPGAESCRLAITQSRGLGRLLTEELRARPDLVALGPDLKIKISGCPNGCGQHHIAGIGLQGSVRRVGDKLAPQYFLSVGGGVGDGGARFARLVAKLPARRVAAAIARLLALYAAERRVGEAPLAFFQRLEPERARALLADLEELRREDLRAEDLVDIGDEEEMRVVSLEGECSA